MYAGLQLSTQADIFRGQLQAGTIIINLRCVEIQRGRCIEEIIRVSLLLSELGKLLLDANSLNTHGMALYHSLSNIAFEVRIFKL